MKRKEKKGSDTSFDYTEYEAEVVKGLMEGKGLFGESGLLKRLVSRFIETALEAELDSHLKEGNIAGDGNKRNGRRNKKLRSELGDLEIGYGRDRAGSFEPVTVRKRQRELVTGFDAQILELYAMSNSISDIRLHLEKMYGAQMSESRISNVINAVWEEVDTWHKRSLPACYVVLFADGVHVSVCRDGQYRKVAVYVLYAVTVEGTREIVGMYVGQGGESATEWARCFQDLKNRGLEDVLHFCSDGLNGLKEVFGEAFPLSTQQRCIVHKMRNCMRLIDEKDRKMVIRQLKEVYNALNESQARLRLDDFAEFWQGKYDCIVKLWEKDWTELMACMQLSPAFKKITYTNNAIENLNREIRRVTKTKGGWKSDKALLIQLFLSLKRKEKSWNKKVRGWAAIQRELVQTYGDRFTKHIL